MTADAQAVRRLKKIGATVQSVGGHPIRVGFEECASGWVTHDDLTILSQFASLERICFYGTPVDGRVLSTLTCESTLRSLNLNCSDVTNTDIDSVRRFSNLEFLGLMDTAVNDEAIDVILCCSKMSNLRIDGSSISDAGAARLAKFLPLDRFWISGGQISAASIASIHQRPQMRELQLFGNDVTDDCLDQLEPLAGETYVHVSRYAQLTSTGTKRLHVMFPHLKPVG